MSIEKLTNTIIESAQKKVKGIQEKYEQEIQKIKADTDEQIKKLTQENNELITQQQALQQTQIISNAQLKAQHELLKTKWHIVDDIFQKAQEKFIASDEYINTIKDIISKNSDNNSEIIASKNDFDKLQKLLPNIKLTVNEKLTGGLIIRTGRVDLNSTLDKIIQSLKNDLIIDLSKILFDRKQKYF